MKSTVLLTLSLELVAAACTAPAVTPPAPPRAPERLSTFSIVAHDPNTGDLGVAVQSKVLAVGSIVPWLEADVGAIATQSFANTTYGPRGLALLRKGSSPTDVLAELTGSDSRRDLRQIGIVDARGRAANFTGAECHPWAGARAAKHYTVQGNLLVSEETVVAMATAFEKSATAAGVTSLAERLLIALEAGQAAGGDARGRQSAALVVVRRGGGYGGYNDRHIDLRVDDASHPVAELRRLVEIALRKDPVERARRLTVGRAPEAALEVLEVALRQYPSWNRIHLERARVLFVAGSVDAGHAALGEYVRGAGDTPDAHFQAGEIQARAGLADGCRASLRRALQLNPAYRELLRRALEDGESPFRRWHERLIPLLDVAPGESRAPTPKTSP